MVSVTSVAAPVESLLMWGPCWRIQYMIVLGLAVISVVYMIIVLLMGYHFTTQTVHTSGTQASTKACSDSAKTVIKT